MEAARALFKRADLDGNGTLSVDEFTKILLTVGFAEKDIPALFRAVDVNEDHAVDLDEFFDWLENDSRASKLGISSCGLAASPAISVEIINFVGDLEATLQVSPEASLEAFRGSVRDACATSDFRLLHGTSELSGAGTVAEQGLCHGDRVTLIRVQVDRLIVWGRGAAIAWTHTLAPSQRVAQVVAGPVQAFMLLEEGTCWSLGRQDGFGYSWWNQSSTVPEPHELTSLREACGGPIRRISVDEQEVLFAMAGDEVWMQFRPGCGHYWHEGYGSGARILSLVEEWNSPGGPVRAGRICGKGVVDIHGMYDWGVLTTNSGHAQLYAACDGFLSDRAQYLGQGFRDDLELLHAPSILAEIDLGQRKVKKVAQGTSGPDTEAVLLLDDGHLVGLMEGIRLRENVVAPVEIPGVGDIVDVSSGAALCTVSHIIALDRHGHLWCICSQGDPYRMAVVGGHRVSRLVGNVAVVEGAHGEEAYALSHRRGAVAWASGLGTIGQVEQGHHYGIGHFVGAAPTESFDLAVERSKAFLSTGANLLAFQCGRHEDLRPEEGCDTSRLEVLLASGCSPSSTSPDGRVHSLQIAAPLLGLFAERAAPHGGGAGEPGMAAAVGLLMQHGADAKAQVAAVTWCVQTGSLGGLELLAEAGCQVTSEDRANCAAYEEAVDEF